MKGAWIFLIILSVTVSFSEDKYFGGVVIQPTKTYENPDGKTAKYNLAAGTYCSFMGLMSWTARPKEENGYAKISIFEDNVGGMAKNVWVPSETYKKFVFSCDENPTENDWCPPVVAKGFKQAWAPEFKEKLNEKMKDLGLTPAAKAVLTNEEFDKAVAAAQKPKTEENKSEVLTNESVIGMVASGLSPAIIGMKIKSSEAKFDLSNEGLKMLQDKNVPMEIIEAMMKK